MGTYPGSIARRIIALALAGLSSCSGLKTIAKAAFQKPELVFLGASLNTIDLDGATVFVEVELQNPNGFGLNLARVDWTLDAERERVAEGSIPGGLEIPASGTVAFPIPVHVRFHDVPGILGLIRRGGAIDYEAKAVVGVRTPVGIIELEISHADRIPAPQLPDVAFERLAFRSASFEEIGVDVVVAVRNPNFFPAPPGKVTFALALGDDATTVARATNATFPALGPGMREDVAIPVRISLLSAGRAARDLGAGKEVRARITGSAELAGFTIPFDLEGPLPRRR